MNPTLKRVVVLLTALALVAVPCMTCLAQELEKDDDIIAGKMAGDALVVRPLGIAATIIGGAVFVISLPFSALGGNTKPAYDYLVADPFKFTFSRALGEF
ncbi:MAG TPA: hypothetical protein VLT88_09180 [Desulfosarcina sp.]|nr:hypothetical protein [Desulfosarcina sp.]